MMVIKSRHMSQIIKIISNKHFENSNSYEFSYTLKVTDVLNGESLNKLWVII